MKETKPEKQALLGKGGSEGRVDIQVMAGQVRPTCHGLRKHCRQSWDDTQACPSCCMPPSRMGQLPGSWPAGRNSVVILQVRL